ncbi:hypothetical protein CEP53_005989 [Fusarium sp. AF-6]|nr:hypothetical protein CEP53_005989 [Fusarium sp. AF-6]
MYEHLSLPEVPGGYDVDDNHCNTRVAYAFVNGLAIIDGDFVYGTEQDILAYQVTDNPAKRALSEKVPSQRWPNAVVPYSWSDEDVSLWLSDADKKAHMKLFEAAAEIWVGRLPWLKVYEATTTLGLHHEHKRPDRDKYFTLDCAALMLDEDGVAAVCTSEAACKGWGCQLTALENPLVHNWEGPYDTNSVIHYFERSAAKDSSI